MIIGIGCDIIEVARVEKALGIAGFREKAFTPEEIAYCEERRAQKYQSYAARYAAKEALGKALGIGVTPGGLQEIIVKNDAKGRPEILLKGTMAQEAAARGIKNIQLSLSHIKASALAYVILEG